MRSSMNAIYFLCLLSPILPCADAPAEGLEEARVMTVRGPIPAASLGKTLPHEHILCDFIGAEKTGKHRYDPKDVVELMRPRLREIKERGTTGFADCTPAYIGRDPEVLKRLAELEDIHILTNTGYYGAAGDKFLPPHAFTESADRLADRWAAEWRDGIEGTGIRPGFIKIGVDAGALSDVDRKLVVAAARAHLRTGLTVACHTGESRAAREVLEAMLSEGAAAAALIVVHADGIRPEERFGLAEAGAWVELDGVGGKPIEEHVKIIQGMLERKLAGRLLLSHDAGWYSVGAPDGGRDRVRPFTAIDDALLPALRKAGIEEATIEKLLVENPREAFAVRVRKR
jgi:predicted metal-dependent phosphotriesterase family hydrolase